MRGWISLTLDPDITQVIERLDRDIAASRRVSRLFHDELRPHITLGIFGDIDVPRAVEVLDQFAGCFPAMTLTFASLGIFLLDPPVLFAAPVVTSELLARHAWLHERLDGIVLRPDPPYLPAAWVPHCTIAAELPADALPGVVTLAGQLPMPLSGQVSGICLAPFPSGTVLHAVPLAATHGEREVPRQAPGGR